MESIKQILRGKTQNNKGSAMLSFSVDTNVYWQQGSIYWSRLL